METANFLGSLVALDRAATRQWYASAEPWGCDCGDCRNFLAAVRRGMLPGPMTEVLDTLGIPPEKATYVCLLYETGGMGLYQFSYRVAGRILRRGRGENWGGCGHEAYPHGAPGFPEPHFDLEFTAELPYSGLTR